MPPEKIISVEKKTNGKNYFQRRIFSFAVFFVWWSAVFGTFFIQNAFAQYRFDSFTTDNGLPQNGVRAIAQTPDGYLWLTTFDGVVRFDGAKFTVFDKNNSNGILSNRFFLLHADAGGTLYAGTEDGGLTVYKNGVFKTYTAADGLPSNKIENFGFDAEENFYLSTSERRVYFRDGAFASVPENLLPNESRFYRSPNGILWLYDEHGLRRLARAEFLLLAGALVESRIAEDRLQHDRPGVRLVVLARQGHG